jgi:hypothetical protein
MAVKLKRPKTLKEGREYLWQESTSSSNGRSPQQVTFVAYDPCPVFVIVRDEAGRRWRCPREVIFILEILDRNGRFTSLARAIADSNQEYPAG